MSIQEARIVGVITPSVSLVGTISISSESGTSKWSKITEKPFESIDPNTLKVSSGVLTVFTTDDAEEDNTKPITSSGVQAIVGNINTLLSLI